MLYLLLFLLFQWWAFHFVRGLFTSFLIISPQHSSLTLLKSDLTTCSYTFSLLSRFLFYFLSLQSFLLACCVYMRKLALLATSDWLKLHVNQSCEAKGYILICCSQIILKILPFFYDNPESPLMKQSEWFFFLLII